ncbi:MAG TPA: hypothetical protein DDZ51_31215 [Planctomycetaceae bacterium]|nr:hypothetical protein [Planctomycetaceae bacterium]
MDWHSAVVFRGLHVGNDFGVMIGCCKQDLRYAVGCYASIRHFMPQTRICFLYDGWETPDIIRNLPLATTLNRSNVQSEVLRDSSFGPGVTKIVAFFESPFEHFLFLDADTVVCGDLQRINELDRYDFIIDKRGRYDDHAISRWFFDTTQMKTCFPDFEFASHREDYFCTGVFMARRGSIQLDRYLEVLAKSREIPNLFKFWEMGMLNFLIFEAKDQGRIAVLGRPYQLVASDHDPAILKATFDAAIYSPDSVSSPSVFHFPSPKSFLFQKFSYSEPMTFFRRRFAREFQHLGSLRALLTLLLQDFKYIHYPSIRGQLRRLLKRSV